MENHKKDILNNKTGFKVPENYFDEFENKFKLNSNKLESGYKSPVDYFDTVENKIISNLELNKTSGFKVPKDYFDKVENKIINNRTKNTKVFTLFNNSTIKLIGLSIAASLLLFFGLNNYNSDNNNLELDLSSVSLNELDSWMEEDLITFNTYEISDTFSDNELNLIDNENDEITDYLNFVDVEDLILEN